MTATLASLILVHAALVLATVGALVTWFRLRRRIAKFDEALTDLTPVEVSYVPQSPAPQHVEQYPRDDGTFKVPDESPYTSGYVTPTVSVSGAGYVLHYPVGSQPHSILRNVTAIPHQHSPDAVLGKPDQPGDPDPDSYDWCTVPHTPNAKTRAALRASDQALACAAGLCTHDDSSWCVPLDPTVTITKARGGPTRRPPAPRRPSRPKPTRKSRTPKKR